MSVKYFWWLSIIDWLTMIVRQIKDTIVLQQVAAMNCGKRLQRRLYGDLSVYNSKQLPLHGRACEWWLTRLRRQCSELDSCTLMLTSTVIFTTNAPSFHTLYTLAIQRLWLVIHTRQQSCVSRTNLRMWMDMLIVPNLTSGTCNEWVNNYTTMQVHYRCV